jgi:hypothetical protein
VTLPTPVIDLIWVALPTHPYTCTNRACPWLVFALTPWKRTRLTISALNHAHKHGRSCGWCGHPMTMTQRRGTS